MEIVPLGPGFAAELRGVTLAEIAADDAAFKEARAALEQHSVIVFRGQEVTDEAQLAFSRRFGPLEITKVGSLGAGTNLVILSTIDENGNVVPDLRAAAAIIYEPSTGKVLWDQLAFEGKPTIGIQQSNTFASQTPVSDGERVYAYFGMTGIFCFDMAGKPVWNKN